MDLKPSDYYLAQHLGLSEDELRWFEQEIKARERIDPSQPQAGVGILVAIAVVSSLVSVGLAIAASFFKPKANKPPTLTVNTDDPNNVTNGARYAPLYGFNSTQNIIGLGSTIPIYYCNRRFLPAQEFPPRPEGYYGGLRISPPTIWTQIYSVGGSQLLRAIFLCGRGPTGAIDPNGFAIGDNALNTYDLATNAVENTSSRISIYYKNNTGRITGADLIAGRSAALDIANAENGGAPDVFQLRSEGNVFRGDACYTYKPAASTVFGLSTLVPNNLAYRANPQLRPTIVAYFAPEGDEDVKLKIDDDPQALATFWKAKYAWSGRSGIISTSTTLEDLEPGDTFQYLLSARSYGDTSIKMNSTNTDNAGSGEDGIESLVGVAQATASRQSAADNALFEGELFKAGSCLAILTSRAIYEGPVGAPSLFVSDVAYEPVGGGTSMIYTFTVVRAGRVQLTTLTDILDEDRDDEFILPPELDRTTSDTSLTEDGPRYNTCSNRAQIFKVTLGGVALTKPTKVFELAIRSTVGITVNGLYSFRKSLTWKQINDAAGLNRQGNTYDNGTNVTLNTYAGGATLTKEERYSFFRLEFKPTGATEFTPINVCIGVRGYSSENQFNYIRIEQPTINGGFIRLEPLTSWEIRNSIATGDLYVLDTRVSDLVNITVDGYELSFNGLQVPRTAEFFRLTGIDVSQDLQISYTENDSMLSSWGKLDEYFVYDEVQTTASSPEHEIVAINVISRNETSPNYDTLSKLGLHIRSGLEWQQFSQFSYYANQGLLVKTLDSPIIEVPTNNPGDVIRDVLLSKLYGVGENVASLQIDNDGFAEGIAWCELRRYFFDAILSDKFNFTQWAADLASQCLLDFSKANGRYTLRPAIKFPSEGPVDIKGQFSAGNIIEGSFKLEFLDYAERKPVQVSVQWREERARDDYSSLGFFPTPREVIVRENIPGYENATIEPLNISNFCTNEEHAIDFACYVARVKRLTTHKISFNVAPVKLTHVLKPNDLIEVFMDYTHYDSVVTGVVLQNNRLLTSGSTPLLDGDHLVTAWDGIAETAEDITLTVYTGTDGNKYALPAGIVFAQYEVISQKRTYKINSLSLNADGDISVEAVNWPVDSDGIMEIGKNWTTYETDENWIIER